MKHKSLLRTVEGFYASNFYTNLGISHVEKIAKRGCMLFSICFS